MKQSVLSNKQYRQYNKTSRYARFPIYYNKLDNRYMGGTTAQLNQNIPYKLYIVQKHDTIDSISLKFYNNPTYFWIICDFNKINDPYKELVEGETLKIPSMSNLTFDII